MKRARVVQVVSQPVVVIDDDEADTLTPYPTGNYVVQFGTEIPDLAALQARIDADLAELNTQLRQQAENERLLAVPVKPYNKKGTAS